MVTITPETLRRLRRSVLFSLFGLCVFVVALYLSFPSERAKEVAIRTAAARDLDVEIGSASPAFGFGVVFHDILVRTKPATGKPTRFTIQTARLSVSPWSILSSSKTYGISLEAFGGRIDITQSGTPGKKGPFELQVRARDVNLGELPGVRDAINLPLAGTAKLDLRIASTSGKLAESTGEITLNCDNVVIGDGKTPLKVAGNPFLSGGLTLPRVRLDDFGGHVAIDKGLAKLQEIGGKSRDGEVALEGEVTLRDPLPTSTVNAYLRFKLSDAFLRQAPSVQTILQMAGAQGKRPDGFFGMRLSGRLGQLNAPLLSPTSPIAAPPPGRAGTRAAITPTFRPLVPAPSAPPPPSPPAMMAVGASPAPPPEPPPPPPPSPPAPAAPASPPPSTPSGGWHSPVPLPAGTAVADGPPPPPAEAPAAAPPPPGPPPPPPSPEEQPPQPPQ
ncbi:MAG TPA: type II secretion system protein GspN [Polyangia bacterium]|jgi:type II secretion system protein N|nr:type II secretion system protein GspN [Polyangia bacterium]